MLRPLLKLMAFILVTLTVITFVTDSVHSISASHWTVTPFNKTVAYFFQTDIYSLNQFIRCFTPSFLSSICVTLTYLPTWFILGTLAVIFCILSREKQEPLHKISYRMEKYI
ncbi:hypothetical protein BAnh1_01990 [Bartonella australis AUST/NH1]|uniref:Uncharacterized protein n=1 Tax=Bartonella australis (strain Aust/NH1) TaxID=1094489 RepID=M1PBT0_BARAA|nr:hypothetical protein BAnh1_01990 [Bartonella australis AUST/NH1]